MVGVFFGESFIPSCSSYGCRFSEHDSEILAKIQKAETVVKGKKLLFLKNKMLIYFKMTAELQNVHSEEQLYRDIFNM